MNTDPRRDGPKNSRLDQLLMEIGPALELSGLARLESELGESLPDDYRLFLLAVNGGLLPRNSFAINGAPWTPTAVYAVFGLDRCLDTSDLRWNRQTFNRQCLSASLLPIACDPGGCPFCLVIKGPDCGSIVFIDLGDLDRRYIVAASFSEFIAAIEFRESEDFRTPALEITRATDDRCERITSDRAWPVVANHSR
jgi:hypothetical protein